MNIQRSLLEYLSIYLRKCTDACHFCIDALNGLLVKQCLEVVMEGAVNVLA